MTTTSWAKGVDGDFNTASNWTAGVPDVLDAALITVKGTYTVTSSQTNIVASLEMAKDATLSIIDNDYVGIASGTGTALAGTIKIANSAGLSLGTDSTSTNFSNTGTIDISSETLVTALSIAGTVTLTGDGKIVLSGSFPDSRLVSDGNPDTLTNGSTTSGNTISGTGVIGDANMSFTNGAKGIIDADFKNDTLAIESETFTNSGVMEATAKGELVLETNITQTAGGKIKTASSGSSVALDGVTITGGTVSTVKGSTLASTSASSITTTTPIVNDGTIVAKGGNLFISGSVENQGTLEADGKTLTITGTETGKGTAVIGGAGNILFEGASSANVRFEAGSTGILDLADARQFTGSVAGMSAAPGAGIELQNIAFADHPTVRFKAKKHLLIVTDPVTHVTDKITIVGTGSFKASLAGDGISTLITDPPTGTASSARLLVQSMASFGDSGGIIGSGSGELTEHQTPLDFLATNPGHG
jgi:hypothetical protein